MGVVKNVAAAAAVMTAGPGEVGEHPSAGLDTPCDNNSIEEASVHHAREA